MVRLTGGQATLTASAVGPADPASMLERALDLAASGWAVFPLVPGRKVPLLKKAHPKGDPCRGECGRDGHGAWDGTVDPGRITRWWTQNPGAGIGANLGEDRVAFDLDVQHGADESLPFPLTRVHHSGRGNGNRHLIYAFEAGGVASLIRSGTNVLGDGVDVRAGRGSYIVMPPTPHEDTGKPYTADDTPIHVLTDEEVRELYGAAGVAVPVKARAARSRLRVVEGGRARKKPGTSQLSDLLAAPSAEGGRNDWLARVAGHYAKEYRDREDLYRVHVEQANALLTPPLGEAEVLKTANSIWDTEQANHSERLATPDTGFLVPVAGGLACQVRVSRDGETTEDLAPWADFDIVAGGVAVDANDRRTFWVTIKWAGREISATLDSELLGDDRALRRWLAALGASYTPPPNEFPRVPPGVRLLRYLNSQNPPVVTIAAALGFDPEVGGFITHEGVITVEGVRGKQEAGVVADPALLARDIAPFEYGFEGTEEDARQVLREVLTFQDPGVAAVFGAWWAACLLRPQIQSRSSLFPFFGVQAASESGKTNGFFELMVQLNGNTRGQIAPTRPVLRDYASANRNGIVWADDLDSLEAYGELLRASTSNGTAAKMDVDRSAVRNTQIVAPILVSGEFLGLGDQKAMIDRSVIVEVASPKERRSEHGDYLQWEDVLDLKARFPDGLHVVAGWLVQRALTLQDETMAALREAKKVPGRHGEKLAVLRAGARLLDALLFEDEPWSGSGWAAGTLEGWISQHESDRLEQDNALTLHVLPWALRAFNYPDRPSAGETMGRFAHLTTPAFVTMPSRIADVSEIQPTLEDETGVVVWVNTAALADAWARDHNHRVDQRTETELALRQQLDALGAKSKTWAVAGEERRRLRFRALPDRYSAAVLARARGE